MTDHSKNFNVDDLVNLILKRRQAINLKQSALGMELGLSQKQYCMIESGQVNLKLETFLRLADVLDINPSDLLTQAGLLKEFPSCEKSKQIDQLIEENKGLRTINQWLQQLVGSRNED